MNSPWDEFKQDLSKLKKEFPEFTSDLDGFVKKYDAEYSKSVETLKAKQAKEREARSKN